MKILFIGDTVGKPGRRAVTRFLPDLKKKIAADFVILNAENLAGGVATTEKTLREMENAGVDFFTGGNHSFHDLDVFAGNRQNFIRPANFRDGAPGKGFEICEIAGEKLAILNFLGNIFIKNPTTPVFDEMEKCLQKCAGVENILVDFHAEATSEKAAFFWKFSRQISAFIGTHTHAPTADAAIFDGAFFQTDIGMTGPQKSIIGLEISSGIENFTNPIGKKKFKVATGPAVFRAVALEISGGKTRHFEHFTFFENDEK